MSARQDIRRLPDSWTIGGKRGRGAHSAWPERVQHLVFDRLTRMTELTAVLVPLDGATSGSRGSAALPRHPACGDCQSGPVCRRAWEAQVQALREDPTIHWHRCPQGKWCVLAPLIDRGRCRAACKVVASAELDEKAIFPRLELLDVLLENFRTVASDAAAADTQSFASVNIGGGGRLESDHPLIGRALDYIEAHLTDVQTSVAQVAAALGVNATYLAHLFAEHTGWRMGRYVSARRIALARQLLMSTDWQVKKIAFASGHRNADWFSEVFRSHTGLTPSAFRRLHRH